jgi:hypothetical protein
VWRSRSTEVILFSGHWRQQRVQVAEVAVPGDLFRRVLNLIAVNGHMPGPAEANPNDERFTLPRNSLFGYDRGLAGQWGMTV